jgi:Ig-like domain CHU_C associated
LTYHTSLFFSITFKQIKMLKHTPLYLLIAIFFGCISQTHAQTCTGSLTVTLTGATSGSALAAPTGSASQTFCQGSTVANLTATAVSSATIVWYSATSGGTALASSAVLTTGNYYAAQILTGTGCESTSRFAVSVVIDPTSIGGSIAGSATVCTGTNSTAFTLSGHTGNIVKWQSSTDATFTAPTDIANTTTSLTATNLTATTYYRAVVQSGSCTAVNSSNATVTVNPFPVVADIIGTAVICGTTGATTQLANATASGVWSSGTMSVATVNTTGLVTSVAVGTTLISYIVTTGGCSTTKTLSVDVNPTIVAGSCTEAGDACQLSTGQVRITVSGGTTPYSLTANGKTVVPSPVVGTIAAVTAPTGSVASGLTTYLFTGLAGNVEYKFRIADNKGCVVGGLH